MSDKLLTEAAEDLQARGYEQLDSHHDEIESGSGINYLVFDRDGETFYVRAKEYVYQNLAPFGTDMIEDAITEDATLVIYFGDRTEFYAADPLTVRREGSLTSGQSKRSESREWREIGLEQTVPLYDYVENEAAPAAPQERTINASLEDFC